MKQLRAWLLDKVFAGYRDEKIRNAFVTAHKDIMSTMKDDLDAQAEQLAKEKLSKLLSNVDLSRVVRLDRTKGILYIGDKRAEESRLANLKSEVEFLLESDLWGLLCQTPRELAQRAMFIEGNDLDQMTKGRAILFTLSSQENILNILKSFEPKLSTSSAMNNNVI